MLFLLRKVFKLIKPYLKREIIGIFLTILFSISVFLMPKISQYLIDEIIPANSKSKLFYGLIFFTTICFMQPIVGFLKDTLFVRITESITNDLRNGLFKKIIHSNFHFFNNAKGGDLISIIINDGRGASDFISKIFAILLKNFLMVLMIFIGMFIISYEITLFVIGLIIVYFVINVFFGKKLQQASMNIQENYDKICSCINQANNTILSIKTYNQEKSTIDRFEKMTSKMKKDNIKIDSMNILINNLSMVVMTFCLVIIYGFGSLKVMGGQLSIGQVIALGLYFQLLNQPFFEVMNVGISANVNIPIFERIEKYQTLDQECTGINKGIFKFNGISIQNLSFSYPSSKDKLALDNISLHLPSKGIVSIIGESGSGKSSFTKLLLGLFKPDNGKILFGNIDINDISISTLRANISYVPQDPDILNDTIINNIRFGSDNVSDEDIVSICKLLRMHKKITDLENGYESIVTERVNLSGGEKQRILIARGILKKAPIIILDEPLSSLDSENINLVNHLLMDIAKDRLVLMITHHECDTLIPEMIIHFAKGKAEVLNRGFIHKLNA